MAYTTNKLLIRLKKLFGIRLCYGEIAELAGKGPCKRCVGRALADLPVDVPVGDVPRETIGSHQDSL